MSVGEVCHVRIRDALVMAQTVLVMVTAMVSHISARAILDGWEKVVISPTVLVCQTALIEASVMALWTHLSAKTV